MCLSRALGLTSSARRNFDKTYDYWWGEGDTIITSSCTSRRFRFTVSAGVGGSDVKYSLRRWPFTLNCFLDLRSEIGKSKDWPKVGRPDRTETVDPRKWTWPISVQIRSSLHQAFGLGPKGKIRLWPVDRKSITPEIPKSSTPLSLFFKKISLFLKKFAFQQAKILSGSATVGRFTPNGCLHLNGHPLHHHHPQNLHPFLHLLSRCRSRQRRQRHVRFLRHHVHFLSLCLLLARSYLSLGTDHRQEWPPEELTPPSAKESHTSPSSPSEILGSVEASKGNFIGSVEKVRKRQARGLFARCLHYPTDSQLLQGIFAFKEFLLLYEKS